MKSLRHLLFGPSYTADDRRARQETFDQELHKVRGDFINSVNAVESGSRVMNTMAGMINILAINERIKR